MIKLFFNKKIEKKHLFHSTESEILLYALQNKRNSFYHVSI